MALADRRPLELSPSLNNLSTGTVLNDGEYYDYNLNLDNIHLSDEEVRDVNQNIDPIDPLEDLIEDNDDDMEDNEEDNEESDDVSPSSGSRSISPDSLMNDLKTSPNSSRSSTPTGSGSSKSENGFENIRTNNLQPVKKPKTASRVPIATGISTTIPVTGEKPRPSQKDEPSLEDDVLYAIFLILFEKDFEGKGMTVKQICDILIDRHPEMANLSTKTSNLVSAKLNAYVKRVEKGDSSLKYALLRDWADASPKRMVYVYRGLLAADFNLHVKNMMENEKQVKAQSSSFTNNNYGLNDKLNVDSFDETKPSKSRRQTMFDLGISRSFLASNVDKSNLFVPYNTAPVTASLKDNQKQAESSLTIKDDNEDEDEKIDDDFELEGDSYIETLQKNGKRSKSMSYLSSKKNKILTAAAAAPRAPKTPCSHSPNAAAGAAALHAAALKAINCDVNDVCVEKWNNVIRSGFLAQDIGMPEDISLADLDKFF